MHTSGGQQDIGSGEVGQIAHAPPELEDELELELELELPQPGRPGSQGLTPHATHRFKEHISLQPQSSLDRQA